MARAKSTLRRRKRATAPRRNRHTKAIAAWTSYAESKRRREQREFTELAFCPRCKAVFNPAWYWTTPVQSTGLEPTRNFEDFFAIKFFNAPPDAVLCETCTSGPSPTDDLCTKQTAAQRKEMKALLTRANEVMDEFPRLETALTILREASRRKG